MDQNPEVGLARLDGMEMLGVAEIVARKMRIQEVQERVMKDGVHYGTIPGTKRPTLYKSGAETLMATFCLAPSYEVQDLSEKWRGGAIVFQVTCKIASQGSGTFLGAGVGMCSSDEDKYRWRDIRAAQEWEATPEDMRRLKYTREYPGGVKQVRTAPEDIGNTILKMAKKRATTDAVLTVTSASDIFDQDMEDLAAGVPGAPDAGREVAQAPPKPPAPPPPRPGPPPPPPVPAQPRFADPQPDPAVAGLLVEFARLVQRAGIDETEATARLLERFGVASPTLVPADGLEQVNESLRAAAAAAPAE